MGCGWGLGIGNILNSNWLPKSKKRGIFGSNIAYQNAMWISWDLLYTSELCQLKFFFFCPPMQINGSTMLNLSLLTSDMWSVLIRIFAYNEKVCKLNDIANLIVKVPITFNCHLKPIILFRLTGCTLWPLLLLLLGLLFIQGM